MAIRTFSVEETSTFDVTSYGVSKYPWKTTKVGGSFFVPRNDLKREGWKFITSKFTVPDTNEVGILVRRIS